MKGPELLKHYEDNWVTDMGAWFPGERVVLRGKDIFTELNNHTWMEYLIYAVTGGNSPIAAQLMEKFWSLGTSYPEPRLWNNRIAALAGTARTTGALAIAAGSAVSEALVYGLTPLKRAVDFLYRTQEKLDNGYKLTQILDNEISCHRGLPGYGRPVTKEDERIVPLLSYAKTIGLGDGKYTQLAFDVNECLKFGGSKFQINMAGVGAGLASDAGLTDKDFYYLMIPCFVAGMFPCYIDTLSKPEGSFFPLGVDRIAYLGPSHQKFWRD